MREKKGQSGGAMKGTRATVTTMMKRARRKKRRVRKTAPGCDIMFTSNGTEVGVYELKAEGYDKLLASRLEGRVLSCRVEGVMNYSQVYHTAPRDDGVDREVCTPKLELRAWRPSWRLHRRPIYAYVLPM